MLTSGGTKVNKINKFSDLRKPIVWRELWKNKKNLVLTGQFMSKVMCGWLQNYIREVFNQDFFLDQKE